MLTNGTMVTPEKLGELAGVVDTVSVSFDGASSRDIAYIRGAQLYDQLVNAVQLIKSKGIRAHILPTLHALNYRDAPRYAELAQDLGATVSFSLLSGSAERLGKLKPSDECLSCLACVMAGVASANADGIGEEALSGSLQAHVSCNAGKTSVSVAADGTVFPCHMLHFEDLSLGSAFTDSAESIREALAGFRLPSVDEVDGCKTCDVRYLCGGGCRARSRLEYGRLDVRDPYCSYYREAVGIAINRFFGKATV